MTDSKSPVLTELDRKVALLRSCFFNREDQVAAFMPWDRPHPIQAGDNLEALLRAHVEGESAPKAVARYCNKKGGTKVEKGWYRIGSYAPDADGNTRWLCLDFDGVGHSEPLQDPQVAAIDAWRNSRDLGVPAYVERSGGGNGWHLWVFFSQPVKARDARRLGIAIAPSNAPLGNGGEASARSNRGIEVFPKQDRHRKKKAMGNLLWLPFWHGAPEGANQFHRLEGNTLVPYLPDSFETASSESLVGLLQNLSEPDRTDAAEDVGDAATAGAPPSSRATADDEAVQEYLRRVGPDDDTLQPPSSAWQEWRKKALATLPIEELYGDLLTGEVSGEHWLQCRDPESPSGVDSRSGSVATGDGEAPRGTFHSWRTEETLSVFDFMVRRGVAADFSDALRKVAQLTGVPLPTPPAPPRPTAPPAADSSYPTIVVNNRQFRDILWDSWQVIHGANARQPSLFRRSGRLVSLLFAGSVPQMEFIDDTVMYGILAKAADWVKRTDDGDDNVMPPHDVARVMVASTDSRLPPLEAVVTAPVYDQDKRLASTPGYHPNAALWYHELAGFQMPPVPATPSGDDVERAKAIILGELLVDFTFVSHADRAHAVAGLLLPFVRRLIPGPTPIHLFEAPMVGAGKTLLAEVIYLVATGESADPTTLGRDDEETRKKITSVLSLGRAVVLIDNVRDGIDSANLAAALTAETWQDRLLGQNKMVRFPNRAVWLVTANNPNLTIEIARRSIRIRIEPVDERPWERKGEDFRHWPLKPWVVEHRGELVWAILVLIQAWIAGGSPAGPRTLGSFEQWANVIGGILEEVGIDGFLGNSEELYEAADIVGQEWREFVQAWWDEHGATPVAAKRLLELAQQHDMLSLTLGSKSERSQAIRLGKALASNRNRRFGHYRIEAAQVSHNQRLWRLVEVAEELAHSPGANAGEPGKGGCLLPFQRDIPPNIPLRNHAESLPKGDVGDVGDVKRGYAGVIGCERADGRADRLTHASVSACAPPHHAQGLTPENIPHIPHIPQPQENQGLAKGDVRQQHPPTSPGTSPEPLGVDLADLEPDKEDA